MEGKDLFKGELLAEEELKQNVEKLNIRFYKMHWAMSKKLLPPLTAIP